MVTFFSIIQSEEKLLTVEQEAVVEETELVVVVSWLFEQFGVDEYFIVQDTDAEPRRESF